MYKGSDFIGKPVVSYDEGRREGYVKRLLLDPEHNRVLGFEVQSPTQATGILPVDQVKAVGAHVVLTSHAVANPQPYTPSPGEGIYHDEFFARRLEILTEEGRTLGTITDVYLDTKCGKIVGYATKKSDYGTERGGPTFVPTLQDVKVGKEILFVPERTVEHMQEHPPATDDALRHTAPPQAEPGAEKFVVAGANAHDEPLTLPEVEGRRAVRPVYTDEREIIVAQGQIITPAILRQAREARREQELIESVRPPSWGVHKLVGEERWPNVRFSLQEEVKQLRRGAGMLWQKIKESTAELSKLSTKKSSPTEPEAMSAASRDSEASAQAHEPEEKA